MGDLQSFVGIAPGKMRALLLTQQPLDCRAEEPEEGMAYSLPKSSFGDNSRAANMRVKRSTPIMLLLTELNVVEFRRGVFSTANDDLRIIHPSSCTIKAGSGSSKGYAKVKCC